jgi:hypothetical protein
MNLSTADLRNYWTEFHETWWSYRYVFLVVTLTPLNPSKYDFDPLYHKAENFRTSIESNGKVEISCFNVDNF